MFSLRSKALKGLAGAGRRIYEKTADSIEELLEIEKKRGEIPVKTGLRYWGVPQR